MGRNQPIYKGTLLGFAGQRGSNLATLHIRHEDGQEQLIYCENAPTVRALEDAFGDTIGEGHTVLSDGTYIGQEVFYYLDDIDMLLSFVPVKEAPKTMINSYKKQGRKYGKRKKWYRLGTN